MSTFNNKRLPSGLQKSSQYAKDQIDEFHDEKIAVCVLSFMIRWEALGVSFFSWFLLFSREKNLLSRGVQSDSDLEELEDEVRTTKHFVLSATREFCQNRTKSSSAEFDRRR